MPKCSKLPSRAGYVYVLYDKKGKRCKIGKTQTPIRRYGALRGAAGVKEKDCKFFLSKLMENYGGFEKRVHRHFKDCRLAGEWFNCTYDEVVEYICENQEGLSEERLRELVLQDVEAGQKVLSLAKYIILGGFERDMAMRKADAVADDDNGKPTMKEIHVYSTSGDSERAVREAQDILNFVGLTDCKAVPLDASDFSEK